MSNNQPARAFNLARTLRKFVVSAFVIFTFVAYAVHERLINAPEGVAALPPRPTGVPSQPVRATAQPLPTTERLALAPTQAPPTLTQRTRPTAQATPDAPALDQPTDAHVPVATDTVPAPTATPRPPTATRIAPTPTRPLPTATTAKANGQYRDGAYTGSVTNAFYGLVQVKATIQNGKLADVQFLQYPSDRRTSQRINSVAIPYLQSEAIQAQSASVDVISGATLTSRAFMQSLQVALNSARA